MQRMRLRPGAKEVRLSRVELIATASSPPKRSLPWTAVALVTLFASACKTYTPDLIEEGIQVTAPEPEPEPIGIVDDDVPTDTPTASMPSATDTPTASSTPSTDPSTPLASGGTESGGGSGGVPTTIGGAAGTPAAGGIANAGAPTSGMGGMVVEPDVMASGGGDTGGTGGSGVNIPDPISQELIDDFEDSNDVLPAINGRNGYWFANGNTEGTISDFEVVDLDPLNPALSDSSKGVHVVASGFDVGSWAQLGVELNGGDAYAEAADYSGITFWGRAGGGTEGSTISLKLATTSTEAADNDHFGITFEFDPDWTEYLIPFDEEYIRQQGFGDPVTFDPAELTSLQFSLAAGQTGFDVWIDDVEFAP